MSEFTSSWAKVHRIFCEAHQDLLPKKQAKQFISETESGLIRLVLPQMGFDLPPGKMTKATKALAFDYMDTLLLKKLPLGLKRFETCRDATEMSSHSLNTYGSRVRNWFAWLQENGYWPGRPMTLEVEQQCAPFTRHGYGAVKEVRMTKHQRRRRTQYALKPAMLPSQLQHWLEESSKFLSLPHYPGRVFEPLDLITIEAYSRVWCQILGWQVHYNGVPLEDLEPRHIFPTLDLEDFEERSPKEQKRLWRTVQRELNTLLCGYREFLNQEMNSSNPYTWNAKLGAVKE